MVRNKNQYAKTNDQLRVELFKKSVQLAFFAGGLPNALEEATHLYEELLNENNILDGNLTYLEEILPTNVLTPTLSFEALHSSWQAGDESPKTANTLVGVTIIFNNLQFREIAKTEILYAADFETTAEEVLAKFAEILKREPIAEDVAQMTLPGITTEDILDITKRLTLHRCFGTEKYNMKRLELFNEYEEAILETNHYGGKYDKARKKARTHFGNTINRVFENAEKRLKPVTL